jgi:hypothetical protein
MVWNNSGKFQDKARQMPIITVHIGTFLARFRLYFAPNSWENTKNAIYRPSMPQSFPRMIGNAMVCSVSVGL